MIAWYCNLLFFSWLYFHICLWFFHQMYTWYINTDRWFFILFFNLNHRSCAKHVCCSRDWIVVSQNSVSEEQEATMIWRSKGSTEILFQKLLIPTCRANNVDLLTSEQLWQIPNSSVWSSKSLEVKAYTVANEIFVRAMTALFFFRSLSEKSIVTQDLVHTMASAFHLFVMGTHL